MNRYPVQVRARRDAPLSRWLWLVKWLLLIPHYVVLAVLWVAFVALTVLAYLAVLFTGRYPHTIFTFNLGVLRWTWRVGYYGYQVLGTDRYPPFTLAEVPDYPAGLTADQPPRLPRWLPLVAWLLAIPHALIVAALTGAGSWEVYRDGTTTVHAPLGLVSVGVLVVAISLAVRGRPPQGLHDLLVGVARWSLRVVAYVALLTASYPPFRLDQGDTEPDNPTGPAGNPGTTALSAPPSTTTPTPAGMPEAGTAVASGRGAGVAGRVLALVAGVLLLLAATGIGVGGGALVALSGNRDASGYLTSQPIEITTSTAAMTAEGIDLRGDDGWAGAIVDYGRVRITASSPQRTDLFVGIATESDVDRWLAGTAHDELANVNASGNSTFRRTAGAIRDVGAPSAQGFWLATASGTDTVVLDWAADDGRFAVVLANASGAAGVTAQAKVATRIPDLTTLGVGLLGGGLLLAVAGFVLIYLGAAGLARRHTDPPPPPPAIAPTTPPDPPQPGPQRAPVGASPGRLSG
ncbi:MAG TPA: DUF4389 domain-containing protein [Pilimelia sp.]|nr:DUF4389 domain-containing protein [Pilimelia sp.]